jgi:hypothetical protein
MQASAATFFGVELGSYENFLPDEEALAAIAASVLVLVSDDSHAVYAQAAGRLAQRLGVEVTRTPGTHTAYRATSATPGSCSPSRGRPRSTCVSYRS